jgi:hypothetical protein
MEKDAMTDNATPSQESMFCKLCAIQGKKYCECEEQNPTPSRTDQPATMREITWLKDRIANCKGFGLIAYNQAQALLDRLGLAPSPDAQAIRDQALEDAAMLFNHESKGGLLMADAIRALKGKPSPNEGGEDAL